MLKQVRSFLVLGLSTLVVLSMACTRREASSVSPSSTSPTTSHAAAGADGATLKVTAPTLVSPINDVKIDTPTATLICTEATGVFSSTSLAYDFELYDSSGTKVRTEVVNGTSWPVAGLDFEGRYSWRVRATSDDAYGPWSATGFFLTPSVQGGRLVGNELFDPLTTGNTTLGIVNDVTFIPNVGARLNSIESFIQYKLQQPLTDGQFSVIITNLSNSNEQWKTKVMSMLQGDGVNVTDNAYRFTADRRNRDSGGTVRWTLRSRGVDAGEPNCGGYSGWSRPNLYLWTYAWAGASARLSVQDGGPNGPTIRACGANFRAPYSPNPHLIRLGSVGGRGGSESLPGATFRNLWVSPNPRPQLPGDTP